MVWPGEWICYDKDLVKSYGKKGRTFPPEYIFSEAKILMQRTRNLSLARRLVAHFDKEGFYNLNRLSNIVLKRDSKRNDAYLYFVRAIMNSNLLNRYFSQRFVAYEIKPVYVRELPIHHISFTIPSERRKAMAEQGRRLYQQYLSENVGNTRTSNNHSQVLEFVDEQWTREAEHSDVVHDLLVFLAEEMIRLNKDKQAEIKRFLGWLEKHAHISEGIDALQGKTIIKNYLGDYQKNESEAPFEDILSVLQRNKRKLGVSLSDTKFLDELEKEYEASLAKLLPIKERLALEGQHRALQCVG